MTEKRFTKCDTIIRDNGEEMSQAEVRDMLNALHDENEELRMDNDIKFWKQECIRETNTNSIFTFELGKAIDEGYVVSEKFKQMMEEWKKEAEKMKEKHKRLFE